MKQRIDVKDGLIIALGTNDLLLEAIQAEYEKSPDIYNAYLNTENFQSLEVFQLFSIKYISSIRHVAGIVMHSLKNKQPLLLNSLIKKGYKPFYLLAQNHKTLSYDKVEKTLLKNKPLYLYEEWELANTYTVMLFLEMRGLFQFDSLSRNRLMNYVSMKWQDTFRSIELSEQMFAFKDLPMEKQAAYKEMNKYFNRGMKELSLTGLAENLIDRETAALIDIEFEKLYENTSNPFYANKLNEARSRVFTKGEFSSFISAISQVLKSFGFVDTIFSHNLSESEKWKLYHVANKSLVDNSLDKGKYELEDLMIVSSFILLVLNESEAARKLYQQEMEEEVYKKFKAKIEALDSSNKELKQELESVMKVFEYYKSEAQAEQDKMSLLEKENNRLKQELAELAEMKKELHSLREFAYEQSNEDVEYIIDDISRDEKINALKEKAIVIVGGHERWAQKLKELIPTIEFIPIEKVNSFESVKKPNQFIFINTIANRHTNYEKILSLLNNSSTLGYINSHVNMDLTINQLYKGTITDR